MIPTYQRCSSLRRLLLAFTRQTFAPEAFEVLVSIDGSEDGTREMVSEFSAPYRLRGIWHPNAGRASACNLGIRAAEADLLVILDDDMEPSRDFLAAHLGAHRRAAEEGNKEICLLGAVPVRFDRNSPPVVQMVGAKYAEHVKKLAQPGYQIEMRDFYTGNVSIRRDTLLRAGGFDGDFKVYGHEDVELFIRLTSASIPVKYSTQALAYQHFEKDFAAMVRDRVAAGQTAVQLARKHPSARDAFLMKKYRQTSRRWRYTRRILLSMSGIWSGMPRLVVGSVNTASRIWPATFRFLAPAALDYVYWASAFSELRVEDGVKSPVE